jgi:exosortase/archaeosortase family protein
MKSNSKANRLNLFLSPSENGNKNGLGILYFMVILVVSHFLWKFLVLGDEGGEQVTFLRLDISKPFIFAAHHIAETTENILNYLGFNVRLFPNNVIRHLENNNSVQIVWSCTGIKQAYIYFCIIAFYRGPWKHKLWYIPMGFVFVYLFNIFRIAFIGGIVGKFPEQFTLWHEYILKYTFYLMIFLLWVVWEEKFANKKKQNVVSE